MNEIQSSSWYDNKWILIASTGSHKKTRIPFRVIDYTGNAPLINKIEYCSRILSVSDSCQQQPWLEAFREFTQIWDKCQLQRDYLTKVYNCIETYAEKVKQIFSFFQTQFLTKIIVTVQFSIQEASSGFLWANMTFKTNN